MRAVVEGHDDVDMVAFEDVEGFMAWVRACPTILLLSLDHDLGPSRVVAGDWQDPGVGMDVVRELVDLPARVPVIVHSSNPVDAPRMQFLLEDAGWPAHRVVPFAGTEWIEADWAPLVTDLLTVAEPAGLVDGAAHEQALASVAGALERLAALHASGDLGDAEFSTLKRRFLGG